MLRATSGGSKLLPLYFNTPFSSCFTKCNLQLFEFFQGIYLQTHHWYGNYVEMVHIISSSNGYIFEWKKKTRPTAKSNKSFINTITVQLDFLLMYLCLLTYDGRFSTVTRCFESDPNRFPKVGETGQSLKGFVPIRCPSPVVTVLLDFRLLVRHMWKNWIAGFWTEILPIDRSHGP